MFSIRIGPLIEMLFNRWKRYGFAAMLANQYISMSHRFVLSTISSSTLGTNIRRNSSAQLCLLSFPFT
jgi:hypothetical protein